MPVAWRLFVRSTVSTRLKMHGSDTLLTQQAVFAACLFEHRLLQEF